LVKHADRLVKRLYLQPKDDALLCELAAVTKQFGGTVACRAIDFEVRPGEVHALLGENGAGKSTLMKILHGVYHPDGGEVRIGGEPVSLQSPRDAERRGIAMIPTFFPTCQLRRTFTSAGRGRGRSGEHSIGKK
jgi:ABC-type sugar transport system ATPase subunit